MKAGRQEDCSSLRAVFPHFSSRLPAFMFTLPAVRALLYCSLVSLCVACGPTTPPESPEGAHQMDVLAMPAPEQERPYSEEEKAQSHGKLGGIWVNCYRSFQPDPDPAAA